MQSLDCLIILTDHNVYDYDDILDNTRLVVDTRNITNGNGHHNGTRVVKL